MPCPHFEGGGVADKSRKDRQVYLVATKIPKPLLISWIWRCAKKIREGVMVGVMALHSLF